MTNEQAEKLTADQWGQLRGIAELEARIATARTKQLEETADLTVKAEAGTLTADEAARLTELRQYYAKTDEPSRTAINNRRKAIISGELPQWAKAGLALGEWTAPVEETWPDKVTLRFWRADLPESKA